MPTSRIFPGADKGFLAGLRGALSDGGVPHDLTIEPVGNCAVKDQVVDKVQRLLLQHAPDVVTGIMGAGLSRHVHMFFSDAGTPFIANDLGGDPLMTGDSRNPYVFCNTLNLWQSMYALGYWAARNLGSKAGVAAALHEAGYGIVHAFWLGFCQAGGGTILATEVTHRNSADEDPTEPLRRIAALQPDFVMAFYSGREGISFVNAYSALGLADTIPLISTPLMTHDYWLPKMSDAAIGVRTAFSWDTTGRAEEHERFRRVCAIGAGMEPAVFTLLGYETGRILCAAVAGMEGAAPRGETLRDALSATTFTSPRGDMRLDEATGEVTTVDYLQARRRQADGALESTSLGVLALPPACRLDYETIRRQDSRSGWLNPYLVT